MTVVLVLLIKLLFVVFIVGLVGGLIGVAKDYVFTPADIAAFKGTFTVNKTNATKETCSECGKEINSGWKVCPHCGTNVVK